MLPPLRITGGSSDSWEKKIEVNEENVGCPFAAVERAEQQFGERIWRSTSHVKGYNCTKGGRGVKHSPKK